MQDGPCVAASIDGTHVAVLRERVLSLYAVEPFAEVSRIEVPAGTTRTLAFLGRQLLVHEPTRLIACALAPRLAITAELTLETPTRLAAISHHYALLASDTNLFVVSATSEATTVAPTRTPATIARAVGLEHGKFLVWHRRGGAELWDAATRLPSGRVAFDLPPDTSDAGGTGKQRSIWVTTSSGDLVVRRLSDGKTTVAPLPGTPLRITWHPMSAWLVMEFDGVPHAVNSVLRTWQRLDIPPERPRTLAPSVGANAYLVVDEIDHLARYEIGVDVRATVAITVAIGGPLPEREDDVPAAPPRAPARVSRVESARVAVEPRDARPEPSPFAAARGRVEPEPAAPQTAAARFDRRADERRESRTPFGRRDAPPAVEAPRAPFAPAGMRPVPPILRADPLAADWRAELLQWSRRVLARDADEELPPTHSPLTELCDHAELAIPARRILSLVYADWLAGHGDVGVASASLVEVASGEAWTEVLGNGHLGRLGLVTSQVGRCLLARAVGTFLDGRDPLHVTRFDGVRTRDLPSGVFRIHTTDLAAAHVRHLASQIGPLALHDPCTQLEAARLEAWLRGWPLVIAPGTVPPIAPRPGELVIALVTPHAAGGPPIWPDA